MWPPTAWIVVGACDGAVAGRHRARDRLRRVLAADQKQPGGDERRVGPETCRPGRRRPPSGRTAARSRPAGRRARRAPGEASSRQGSAAPAGGNRRQHRTRAIGAPPVQEVVVHLHHDAAPGRQGDARSRAESVGARCRAPRRRSTRRRPGRRAGRSSFRRPRRGRRSTSSRPRALAVERRGLRHDRAGDAVQDHVVDERAGAGDDPRRCDERVALRASGRGGSSGSRRSSRSSPSAGTTVGMRSWSRDSPGRSALGAAGGAPTGVPRRAPPGRTACDCAQRISVSPLVVVERAPRLADVSR